MKEEYYVGLIVNKLQKSASLLKRDFYGNTSKGISTKYFILDELLPSDVAQEIHTVFPVSEQMRLMSSFRELKYTSKNFDKFNPTIRNIALAFQDPSVISVIEEITGIENQNADPSFYAGGLSRMGEGHFLNPHIDNSHEASRRYYRTLNFLYYVTPGWQSEYGGGLELWDKRVRRNILIPCLFNRLVVMETNSWSWHSVSPVVTSEQRCCVSNYYFSPQSPVCKPYFHVTSFSARPEQKIRRVISWLDNYARTGVRLLFPQGLGVKDIHKAERK